MNRWDVTGPHGVGVQYRYPPLPIAAFARAVGAETPGVPYDVDGYGLLLPAGGGRNEEPPGPPFGVKLYQVAAGATTPPSTPRAAPPVIWILPPLACLAA